MKLSSIILATLSLTLAIEVNASASTNAWQTNGSSCVPGNPAIQSNLYLLTAGTVKHQSTATGLITMYCPVSDAISGTTNQLTLTYALSDTSMTETASISVQLIRLSRADGSLTTVESYSGVYGSSTTTLVESFTHTFDYLNYYYYIRVDLNRTHTNDNVVMYGVSLDQV